MSTKETTMTANQQGERPEVRHATIGEDPKLYPATKLPQHLVELAFDAAVEAVTMAADVHGATSEEAITAQHAVEHVLRAILSADATDAHEAMEVSLPARAATR